MADDSCRLASITTYVPLSLFVFITSLCTQGGVIDEDEEKVTEHLKLSTRRIAGMLRHIAYKASAHVDDCAS